MQGFPSGPAMDSDKTRNKRLESCAGTAILVVIVCIGAAVLYRQSSFDIARFGIVVTPAQGEQPQPTAKDDLSGVSLAALATDKMPLMGKTEVYTEDTLYEKINGKAPLYVESGFEQLTCQRFVSAADTELAFEIYLFDMGGTKNAYSVYSRQKRADAVDVDILPFAYKTTNGVYAAYGRYYVELVGSAESEPLVAEAVAFAGRLSEMLAASAGEKAVEELEFFPKENLVSGSIKLYLTNAFGYDGLNDTFTARYNLDGAELTMFISRRSDTKQAQQVAANYSSFLVSNGAKEAPAADTLTGAKSLDFYGTIEIIASCGPFLCGVHEADNRQIAEKAMQILMKQMNDIAGTKGEPAR